MEIVKVKLFKKKKKLYGIKIPVILGYDKDNISFPVIYLKKPKHISKKAFEDILDRLEITIKQDKKFIYDEDYIKSLREKAKQSWIKDIEPDKWLREIRGAYD